MKRIAVILMVFLCSSALADEIHFNDGRVIKGAIIRVTATHIEYDPAGKDPFDVLPRGQIKLIRYDNGRSVYLNEHTGRTGIHRADRDILSGESAKKGFHRHDGLYLRFYLGLGYARSEIRGLDNDNLSITGMSNSFHVQLGYALLDNFIVFIDNGATVISKGSVEGSHNVLSDSQEKNDVTFSSTGIGISYYFMPLNIFISPCVSLSATKYDGDFVDGESRGGHSVSLAVGKEWWASDDWGLGFALYGMYGFDEVKEDTFNGIYDVRNLIIGFMFSATYN